MRETKITHLGDLKVGDEISWISTAKVAKPMTRQGMLELVDDRGVIRRLRTDMLSDMAVEVVLREYDPQDDPLGQIRLDPDGTRYVKIDQNSWVMLSPPLPDSNPALRRDSAPIYANAFIKYRNAVKEDK